MKNLILMMAVFSASYSVSAYSGGWVANDSTSAGEWIADASTQCQVWNSNPSPNESIKWSGPCSDGKASGKGVLQWFKNGVPDGQDEGEFRDGKMHGKGISTTADGIRYEGVFFDGKPNGNGVLTFTYPDGSRIEADFRAGEKIR